MVREYKNFIDGEYYTVVDRKYGHRALDLLPTETESVEGCRAGIDRVNAWRRSDANRFDIKPEQFLIAVVKWNRSYYSDGSFMEYNEKVRVLELYPGSL